MTNPALSASARIVAELRDRLKVTYGLTDGDEALENTLEGQTALPEMLAAMVRQALDCEDQFDAIGTRIKAMATRAERLGAKAQNLRAQVAWAMQEAGMKRIPSDALPEATVSLSDGRAPLVIPNDDEVPDSYCRIKKVREPNKKMIRDELEAGERFAFAILGNPKPTLTIRTR